MKHTHWLTLDDSDMARVKRVFASGSGFRVENVYLYPANFALYVVEVKSNQPYEDLDLEINSMGSPLRRLTRRPVSIKRPIPMDRWLDRVGPIAGFDANYGALHPTSESPVNCDSTSGPDGFSVAQPTPRRSSSSPT